MTQFDEFAEIVVWADGRTLTLGEALDRQATDLLDPLWGVVAAWDATRQRHIVNWELGRVLVDPADEDWPRRQLVLELAACEPLDLDLIAAAIERYSDRADRDMLRERGGRVRPLAEGGWVAEHGPVNGPLVIGATPCPECALTMLTESCELARSELRMELRRTADPVLARIAVAPWWCPRYEIWSPATTPASLTLVRAQAG